MWLAEGEAPPGEKTAAIELRAGGRVLALIAHDEGTSGMVDLEELRADILAEVVTLLENGVRERLVELKEANPESGEIPALTFMLVLCRIVNCLALGQVGKTEDGGRKTEEGGRGG